MNFHLILNIPYRIQTDNEEYVDDHRREYVTPFVSDFTISSDGSVDGNITINYDGDVPSGTEFRLYIQEESEPLDGPTDPYGGD